MNAPSAPSRRRKFDMWVFAIAVLGVPICLLIDFLEGYTGTFLSFLPPVGLLLWGLYFAFIPAAIILLIRAVSLRAVEARTRIRLLVGVGLLIAVGWLGHCEGRLRMTLHGFLAQLKSRTTAAALQMAALQILNGETNTQALVPFVSEMKETNLMPAFAGQLFWSRRPRFVELYPSGGGSPGHYSVEWGGHFIGFVGISAGPDDYKFRENYADEWIKWKPGVYVWWRSEFGPVQESVEPDGAGNGHRAGQ